jgi:acyl-CoA oxidase
MSSSSSSSSSSSGGGGGGFELKTGNEYFRFDDLLTAEERAVRARTRALVDAEIAPLVDAHYERAEFPRQAVASLAKLGYAGGPHKGHGCPGMGFLASCLVSMELARCDASVSTFFTIHSLIAMASIAACGDEEQKSRFLPKLARLEWTSSFALTEPEFGSDANSIRTSARRVKGGWVLNGRKRWIGNALFADVNVVWARNAETGQINGFLVEHGSKGLGLSKIHNKMALRIVQNTDMVFDNVFVPDSHRLAFADDFSKGPSGVLLGSRVAACFIAVGLVSGALERAFAYIRTRRQFGQPLASFQLIQRDLTTVVAALESMTLLAWRAARLHEQGLCTHGRAGLAKAHCTKTARECLSLLRDMMGGNGVVTDFGVMRAFCDIEAIHTYEGTHTINSLVAARELTGFSSFKPGPAKL